MPVQLAVPQAPAVRVSRPRVTPRQTTSVLGPTAARTLELFREGKTLADIAAARGLALSTLEGHLAEAIEFGDLTHLDGLVHPERQHLIESAIDKVGASRLAPIRERLGDGFDYGEIRFVRAAYLRRQAAEHPANG